MDPRKGIPPTEADRERLARLRATIVVPPAIDGPDALDEALRDWRPSDLPGVARSLLPPLRCPDGHCGFLVCGDCSHQGLTRQHLSEWDGICPNGHQAVAACGHCEERIRLLGGHWTTDDGAIACTDTSAAFVPHKPKEG